MKLARRSLRTRRMVLERKMVMMVKLQPRMYPLLPLRRLRCRMVHQVEAAAEGEVASRREAPRRVQVDHPPSRIICDINERTTLSRSRNVSHFAHSAFVATFEPKDIRDALSDPNWVNAMHEELENFERNQVWELVEPPPNCKPIGTKWVWKNRGRKW
jgi:hypothetical protein